MLDEADLLNLIRLNFYELNQIYRDLDSEIEEDRNNAGEMVLQTEALAKKLKNMYAGLKPDYEVYPEYDVFMNDLKESMIDR